jgi:hypothetical protein
VKQWLSGCNLTDGELAIVRETTTVWRKRLHDLSWFMRCLNESIARHANEEDRCTGRFWEGRFHSQALLDERALLSCMAYVDLNPLRAGMAETPEQSDFTSIQERILDPGNARLLPFADCCGDNSGIPFALQDYLEFVDWAGREMRPNKRGVVHPAHSTDSQPIMDRRSSRPGLPQAETAIPCNRIGFGCLYTASRGAEKQEVHQGVIFGQATLSRTGLTHN